LAWGDANSAYNNLIYDNSGGIQVYSEATNSHIYNNTIVANRGAGIALQYYGSAPSIKNNIVFGNQAGVVDYGGNGAPVIAFNLTTDPGFTDIGRRNFSLRTDSAARDVGTPIAVVVDDFARVARPSGGGYDIGAFEYSAPQAAPAPPTNVRLIVR
jgi:parallel beta-helix repeat protein